MENVNPKRNPVTTTLGAAFILIAIGMFIVKYLLPSFMELKRDIAYEWYLPGIVIGLGILLIYMNDYYFKRLFNRGEKIIAKKTGTEVTEDEDTTTTTTTESVKTEKPK